jgi:uncharacterized protein YbaP (TraB family)
MHMMRSAFNRFKPTQITAGIGMAIATLFIGTPVAAQTHSCPVRNLVESWKTEHPAAYAKIRSEADATLNGKNIFWKVEKEGVLPSYLLGTVHVSDPRVQMLQEKLQSTFDNVANVVLELSEVTDSKKMTDAMMKRPDLMTAKAGQDIKSFVGDKNVPALDAALKDRGLTSDTVSKMNPALVYTFVAMPACEFMRQARGEMFLDKAIGLSALRDGKQLFGLETPVEQLEALASLPDSFIKQSLLTAVTLGSKLEDLTATMIELYLEQDIGAILPLMNAATEIFADGDADETLGLAEFEEVFITKRNQLMAERAVPYIDKGPTFIAVGALHLPGKNGVVELLRTRGYKLTPMALN